MSDSINLSKAQAEFMYKMMEKQLHEKEKAAREIIAEIEADKALMDQLSQIIGERIRSISIHNTESTDSNFQSEWPLLRKVDFILSRKLRLMTIGEIALDMMAIDDSYKEKNELKLLLAATMGPYAKSEKRYYRIKEDDSASFKYGLIDWKGKRLTVLNAVNK
jgi:hypothetical protein